VLRFVPTAIPAIAAIALASAAAQQPAHPAFDVASIKPAAMIGNEGGNRARVETTPTSLTMRNVGLSDIVQWAYGVAFFQLSAPHVPPDAYDILAKTGDPVPPAQLRLMLQDLLVQRFKLALHRETRMLPVYELVVATGRPKLSPSNAGAPHPPTHAAESLPRIRNNSFLFADVSLPEFAEMLMQLRGVDLPVVDRTGITGTFDIELKSAPAAARDADTPALFNLIEEQLGLQLKSAKAPIEILVIDHVERPSGN
jgi:uncharacterized protein (TIGR03435 family)